jgi:hypothetical protein
MRRTMSTIQDIRNQLSTLVTEAHKVACALDIGDERTMQSNPMTWLIAALMALGALISFLLSGTKPFSRLAIVRRGLGRRSKACWTKTISQL